jgi:hypothetical protein
MTTDELKQAFELIEIPETLDLGYIRFTDLKRNVKDHFAMIESEKLRHGKNVHKSAIAKASKNHLEFILKNIEKSI